MIPQVRIHLDYERAALYGMTPAAVGQALEAMSNGRRVSQIVEGNRRFDVVMRLADQDRSTTGLGDLLIATPSGHVPLRMLAAVEEGDGPNQILRENAQRRIVVFGNGDGRRDMAAIIADIRRARGRSKLAARLHDAASKARSRRRKRRRLRIGLLSLVSLALIFVVLYSRYKSAALALIIMGEHSAGADRQRARAVDRGPAALGRLDDRLHHARRHLGAQRHPEDLPLHQPRAVRGRAASDRALIVRGSPRAAGAGADDGAGGGPCADPAAVRRRTSRAGRSCIRSR